MAGCRDGCGRNGEEDGEHKVAKPLAIEHGSVPIFYTPDVRRTGAIALTDAEIRERMSGNLCRCGAYANIGSAVRSVARQEGVA